MESTSAESQVEPAPAAATPVVPLLTMLAPVDDAAVCGPDGMCL